MRAHRQADRTLLLLVRNDYFEHLLEVREAVVRRKYYVALVLTIDGYDSLHKTRRVRERKHGAG